MCRQWVVCFRNDWKEPFAGCPAMLHAGGKFLADIATLVEGNGMQLI